MTYRTRSKPAVLGATLALAAAAAVPMLSVGAGSAFAQSHSVSSPLLGKDNCGYYTQQSGNGVQVGTVTYNAPNEHAAHDLTVAISTTSATADIDNQYDAYLALYASRTCSFYSLGVLNVVAGVGSLQVALSVGPAFGTSTSAGQTDYFEVVLNQNGTGTVLYATNPTPVTLNA